MKINEFVAGETIEMPLLLVQVKEGVTNTGSPYLSLTLRDNTGTIEGKIWDVKEKQTEIAIAGNIVNIKADIIKYRGVLQLKITGIFENFDEIDMNEYVLSGPYSQKQLREEITNAINSIKNKNIFRIVSEIYRKYDEQIYSSAAATKNHHEYFGGLATHICSMLKLADLMCINYPYLSRDLLVAGVLLHDIGKIIEIKGSPVSEYTLEGKLIGHISLSQTIVKETADYLGIDSEEVTLLRHMVLSHHGVYEFGSPVLPSIIEAEALHFIDDMDAKMVMIEKELSAIPNNEFTQRNFALENRAFYKHGMK